MATPNESLIGSLAPIPNPGMVQVNSTPFSSLPANATTYIKMPGKFTRGIRSRTLVFVNTMDQDATNALFYMEDTAIGGSGLGAVATPNTTVGTISHVGAPQQTYASASYPNLAANTDSGQLQVTIGATAPTTGNLVTWASESN